MAFDLTALSAYIEDQDFPLVAQMQATGGLVEQVNIQAGIKGSSHLQFLSTDVVFGAGGSCTRVAADTTTFTQRTIVVGAIDISENLCVADLNGFWTQTMVKKGAAGEESLPGDIERVWMEKKQNELSNQLTIADFQGDTGSGTNNLSYYDGLLKIVDAATVVDGNTGAVTVATGIDATNVLDILDAMWTAIPDRLVEKTDMSLWVPTSVYKLYIIALKNANLFHISVDDGTAMLYGTNIPIRPTIGLPGAAGSQRMILTYDSNITIGMDGDADTDILKVRLDPVTEKNIFFDMSFKRGVQFAFENDIVEFTLVP
jgi:hypothetical protein